MKNCETFFISDNIQCEKIKEPGTFFLRYPFHRDRYSKNIPVFPDLCEYRFKLDPLEVTTDRGVRNSQPVEAPPRKP